MKIVIDLDEINNMSLTPYSVYRALYMEYWDKLQKSYHNPLFTYCDAEKCFELFKQFADVWVSNV